MRNWELTYERPSMSLDAILFAVALLLHAPLTTLHLKASKTGSKAKSDRLLNIDYITVKAQERKDKPAALPPKVVSNMDDAVKKAAEIREKLLKKALPKPEAPKPKLEQELKMMDPAKIQMELKQKMAQVQQPQLKDGKSFMDKPAGKLAGAEGAKDIKMGGGVSAIQMGAKPGANPGRVGPVLAGRSGFSVSEKSAPVGIGGGPGDIKMGGGAAIVVPTSKGGRADASILSPVASIKDKGALKGGAGVGDPSAVGGVGGPSGLALGPGGKGSAIAVAGRPGTGTGAPMPAAVVSSKSFSEKSASSASAAPSAGLSGSGGSALPTVDALARRPGRPQRNMFQITGPLQNRAIVSRVIPPYPAWAQARGIEASVTLQLTVSPDGTVRSSIIVLRTSGYPQLDQSAVDSLRQWRFGPLPMDQQRDEVGTITFQFSVQ